MIFILEFCEIPTNRWYEIINAIPNEFPSVILISKIAFKKEWLFYEDVREFLCKSYLKFWTDSKSDVTNIFIKLNYNILLNSDHDEEAYCSIIEDIGV